MSKLVCVGRAVWDQIYTIDALPLQHGKIQASSYHEAGGGPGATAAVAIAKLGGNVDFWGVVGDDTTGRNIIAELDAYGVNTAKSVIIAGLSSPVSSVIVDSSGERAITAFGDSRLYQSTAPLPQNLPEGTNQVLGDIRWLEGSLHTFKLAKAMGIKTLLDIETTNHPLLAEAIALSDYSVFSKDGLLSFTGESDLEKALKVATRKCSGLASVTNGTRGCFWFEDGEVQHQPSFQVKAVDTTGAGDVFHGALALFLAEGHSFKAAARLASAVSALKCTKPGGRAGIPSRAELEVFLAVNSNS